MSAYTHAKSPGRVTGATRVDTATECSQCRQFVKDGAIDAYSERYYCAECLHYEGGIPHEKLMLADKCSAGFLGSLLNQISHRSYYETVIDSLPYLIPNPRKHYAVSKEALIEELQNTFAISGDVVVDRSIMQEDEPANDPPITRPNDNHSASQATSSGNNMNSSRMIVSGNNMDSRSLMSGQNWYSDHDDDQSDSENRSRSRRRDDRVSAFQGPPAVKPPPRLKVEDVVGPPPPELINPAPKGKGPKGKGGLPPVIGKGGPPPAIGKSGAPPGTVGSTPGAKVGGSGVRCNHCNESGHLARECPLIDSLRCHRCGGFGHMQKDCTKPYGYRPPSLDRMQQSGPSLPAVDRLLAQQEAATQAAKAHCAAQQAHKATDGGNVDAFRNMMSQQHVKFIRVREAERTLHGDGRMCNLCGIPGHMGRDCPKKWAAPAGDQ